MKIPNICIVCLLIYCCHSCFGDVSEQDEEQTTIVHSLKKDDSLEFDGIFFLSSELDAAYENALGVLTKTCEIEDLKRSIAKIEKLGQKLFDVYPEDISNFVQTLRALMDCASTMDQQEFQNMEAALNASYNNITQKLNSYINLN
ncbi:MAG: hypothetical protein LBD34_04155 [Puniceicoccales bacterium]|nr:hypothetical protein [Puniceicoccales bacterium]